MLYLLISDDGAEREAALPAGLTRIGRLATNDLVLLSEDVSREHAELRFEGGTLHARDLGASNRTYVERAAGGEAEPMQPHAWTRINPGDAVRFGATSRLEIHETQGATDDAPRPGDTPAPIPRASRLLMALAAFAMEQGAPGATADAALERFVHRMPGAQWTLVAGRDKGELKVCACATRSPETRIPTLHLHLAEEALSTMSDGVRWAPGNVNAAAMLACRIDANAALVIGLESSSVTPPADLVALARVASRLVAGATAQPTRGNGDGLHMPLDWREALHGFERSWCAKLWSAANGRMSECARLSGLDRSNIRRRLRDHGLGGSAGGEEDTLI